MYTLRTLGALEIRSSNGRLHEQLLSQPRRLALLVYLAASDREYHSRRSLAAVFWPNASEPHARGALKQAVFALRRTLGRDAILARGTSGLAINRQAIECDVPLFRDAVRDARFEEAVALYRGGFLESTESDDAPAFRSWVMGERAQLEEGYRAARNALERTTINESNETESAGRHTSDASRNASIKTRRRKVLRQARGGTPVVVLLAVIIGAATLATMAGRRP